MSRFPPQGVTEYRKGGKTKRHSTRPLNIFRKNILLYTQPAADKPLITEAIRRHQHKVLIEQNILSEGDKMSINIWF